MPVHPKTEGAIYNCFNQCPICWSITETNIQRMRAGEKIVLCTWREFLTFCIRVTDEATGNTQGVCPLCVSIATHILHFQGQTTYIDGATLSMFLEPEDGTEYLKRLGINISQQRDLWKDPAHRAKYLAMDPERFKGTSSWMEGKDYTFHMAFCTKGGPTDHYVQQTMADPIILSSEVFAGIRIWFNECLIEHERCPALEGKPLPSRVLDLGQGGELVERIKIIETGGRTASARAVYAALSYCWGPKTQEVLLTKTTLGRLKSGIEVAELPKTLRDAILVTQQLGLRYLWIDALCIVQDSDEDKAKELSQMPNIYKNAIVTISAAIADDCHKGFLHDRTEVINRIEGLYNLQLIWDVLQPDGKRASDIFLSTDDNRGFKIKDYEDEVIESRAWTFQEAWLSPRLIVFGSGPVQWRCLSKMQTQGFEEKPVKPGKSDMIKRLGMPQYQEREKFFLDPVQAVAALVEERLQIPAHETSFPSWLENWMIIASHYSKRQIRFRTDKLPALSAIASEFGRMYGDQYLAGLWKSGLPWALLWHCAPEKPIDGPMKSFTNTSVDEQEDEKARRQQHLARLTIPQMYDLTTKYTRSVSVEYFQKKPNFINTQTVTKTPQAASKCSSEVQPYVAPSWSFASVDTRIVFASHEWDGPHHTLLTIHCATTVPKYANVSYGAVTEGSMTLTGPMQSLSHDEVLSFFVVVEPETWPHVFWDCIIPDVSDLGQQSLGSLVDVQKGEDMADINPQLARHERIVRTMLRAGEVIPEAEKANDRPPPPSGTLQPFSEGRSSQEFYFLEVTWTQKPRGLVLVRKGKDEKGVEMFQRVGYFTMGRNNYQKTDWRIRGLQHAGDRDWDWYDALKMYTIKII